MDRTVTRQAINEYLRAGFKVFPCVPGGKHPEGTLAPSGFKSATDDWALIDKWWPKDGSGPDYNIGVPAEGLCIIDIDVSEDRPENGFLESLNDPEMKTLADCVWVHTPRGGLHIWTRKPSWAKWGNSQGRIHEGVDCKTDGGYVVAPPSIGANGVAYAFDADSGLKSKSEIPATPGWLHDRMETKSESSERGEVGTSIRDTETFGEGKRNGGLMSIAGKFREYGMSLPEIEAALAAVNLQRCEPPLPAEEVEAIARSASRYKAGDEFQAIAQGAEFDFKAMSHQEFMAQKFEQKFLVNNLIVDKQHLIIGGQQKTFKTSLLVDICVSLATGRDALGCSDFAVPEPIPCLIVSGESGSATLQATAKRVSGDRGVGPGDFGDRLFWGESLPNLTMLGHLENLRKFIEGHGIRFAAIDPAYLAMMLGDDAKNLFKTGAVLRGFGEIGADTGCTLCLCHHLNKASAKNKIPQLADLSQAGFAEWCRQWILLGHDSKYSQGRADLHANVGGSAGHGSLYKWSISQGPRLGGAVGWSDWKVTVEDQDAPEMEAVEQAEDDDIEAEYAVVFERVRGLGGDQLTMTEAIKPLSSSVRKDIESRLLCDDRVKKNKTGRGTYLSVDPLI